MLAVGVQLGARGGHTSALGLLGPLLLIIVGVSVGGLLLPLMRLLVDRVRAMRRDRRARAQPMAADEQRARAVMSELCPHGWEAQVTLFENLETPAVGGQPPRTLVALDWCELRPNGSDPAVVRRVWADSISQALEAMVADRRTDLTLEQIESRAHIDGLHWPDA